MPSTVIACVNEPAADQPQLLTFYNQASLEICDADANFCPPDNTQYETPGVIADDVELETDNTSPQEQNDPSIQSTSKPPPIIKTVEATDTPGQDNIALEYEPATEAEPTQATTPTIPAATVRRSTQERRKIISYHPTIEGKMYQYAVTQLAQLEHKKHCTDPRVVEMILTQLILKATLKQRHLK